MLPAIRLNLRMGRPARVMMLGVAMCPVLMSKQAARAGENVERREFQVGSAPHVRLETYRGSITVAAGPSGKVRMEVHEITQSGDPAVSDEAKRRLHLEWTAGAAGISLVARNPADTRARFVWEEKYKLSLSYVLTVPSDAVLDLSTRDGGITVGDLSGSVTAHGRKGTIYLKQIQGDIDATDEEGMIVVSHGGRNVRAVDRVGDIQLGPVAGRLEARNQNGDIDAQRVGGPAFLYADAGEIALGLRGDVSAAVNASTNGGAIILRLDPSTRCTLKAASVWGKVRTRVPFEITRGGNGQAILEGRCNGGGATVTLHANGGQIEIRPTHS